MEFTHEMVDRIIKEFPQCIECGDNHLASSPPTYFHKSFCLKGAGLDAHELVKRMKDRWEIIQYRDSKSLLSNRRSDSLCKFCNSVATGTGWVSYHVQTVLLEVFPLCDNHSDFDDDNNRPHGFIEGLITTNPIEVQRRLFEIKFNQ